MDTRRGALRSTRWTSIKTTFTRAFTRHYYDARTDEAADALARVYVRLDRCKSQLELANQTLGDVVGVYDTQEAGYQGNTLMGAFPPVRSTDVT